MTAESRQSSAERFAVHTYAAIRGLDAFHKVCEGIQVVAPLGSRPANRVT
jgi:hypothetical protein